MKTQQMGSCNSPRTEASERPLLQLSLDSQPPEWGRDRVSHSLPSFGSLADCQHGTNDRAQSHENLGLERGLKTRDFLPEKSGVGDT